MNRGLGAVGHQQAAPVYTGTLLAGSLAPVTRISNQLDRVRWLQYTHQCERKFGVAERQIFADKQSGKDFERQSYQKMIRKLIGRYPCYQEHQPLGTQL